MSYTVFNPVGVIQSIFFHTCQNNAMYLFRLISCFPRQLTTLVLRCTSRKLSISFFMQNIHLFLTYTCMLYIKGCRRDVTSDSRPHCWRHGVECTGSAGARGQCRHRVYQYLPIHNRHVFRRLPDRLHVLHKYVLSFKHLQRILKI